MKRVVNSREQYLVNDVKEKLRKAFKNHIGQPADPEKIRQMFRKAVEKMLNETDGYSPIAGPKLPRSDDGDPNKC